MLKELLWIPLNLEGLGQPLLHSIRDAAQQRSINHIDETLWKLVLQLMREIDSLWTFLDVPCVEPTNNVGERSLRFSATYRKRYFGTRQESWERFVERIMSLRQTCRIKSRITFPVLVDAFSAWFNSSSPNVSFCTIHTP